MLIQLAKYRRALKWISLVFIIKLVLFIFFATQFLYNWDPGRIIGYIFIVSGDTADYYPPIESFVNGNGYSTICRMPGLLPIYGPLYFLFGGTTGKALVVVFQFFADVLSTYLLARTAQLIFKRDRVFLWTLFVYSLNSFVHIWCHIGYSDSFGVSLLIAASYFIAKSQLDSSPIHIILCGICIAWSIFFRPVNAVIIGVFALLLLLFPRQKKIRNLILLFLPTIISILIWAGYNYQKSRRIILTQGETGIGKDGCFTYQTKSYLTLRKLIIAWGEAFQPWIEGGEIADWFFSPEQPLSRNPFTSRHYTKQYNLDSLVILRENYQLAEHSKDQMIRQTAEQKVINSTSRFLNAYKKERFFYFWIVNKLKLIKQFIFPKRLDDLPFPPFSKMEWYHKLVKGGYLILLNIISFLSLIGSIYCLAKKEYILLLFSGIGWATVITIAVILGFIEQRYLVQAYPFLTIFAVYALLSIKPLTLLIDKRGTRNT